MFQEAMYFVDILTLLESLAVVKLPPTYKIWLLTSQSNEYTAEFTPFEDGVPNGDHC